MNQVATAIRPELESAIDSSGKGIAALAGAGILRIEYHVLDFSESQNPPNPNWVGRSKTITPPPGWTSASVSVSGWDFDFYPRERPITYLGVSAGIKLIGSTLELTAYAICRDSNADDPWRGHVKIQVIFQG
ncbi:MAG: hypothetical protein U0793_16710 [Gemmataceae bacterium]